MINLQEKNKAMVESLIALGCLKNPRIIDAFLKTPRHIFVPKKNLNFAYYDIALPSLKKQTISQPYTVANMLEALSPDIGDNILDIGSGTGWTTCILSRIVGKRGYVTGLEIEPELVNFSKKNIKKLGIKNVEIILSDGKGGYNKNSPYDCVLINAGCDNIPKPVIEQTKRAGRIVAPINVNDHQELTLFQKISDEELTRTNLGKYIFIRLR